MKTLLVILLTLSATYADPRAIFSSHAVNVARQQIIEKYHLHSSVDAFNGEPTTTFTAEAATLAKVKTWAQTLTDPQQQTAYLTAVQQLLDANADAASESITHKARKAFDAKQPKPVQVPTTSAPQLPD